jgi:hypothetical protein
MVVGDVDGRICLYDDAAKAAFGGNPWPSPICARP